MSWTIVPEAQALLDVAQGDQTVRLIVLASNPQAVELALAHAVRAQLLLVRRIDPAFGVSLEGSRAAWSRMRDRAERALELIVYPDRTA